MSISKVESGPTAFAKTVRVTSDRLRVLLRDGREIAVPLSWYPRLSHGQPKERQNWELIGRGIGIHWPDLDEDISVDGLLEGRRSRERADSIKRWLTSRTPTRSRQR
ncbi:MAG: DUF2442 domain-containing protein [Gemmatimonadaceae bacterium]